MEDQRQFARGTEWNREGRKFHSHYIIRCSKCRNEDQLRFNRYTHSLPPDVIAKRFAQRGWVIGSTRANDTCPACVAALVDDRHKRENIAKQGRKKAEADLAISRAKHTPDHVEVDVSGRELSRQQMVLLDRYTDMLRDVAYVRTMAEGIVDRIAEIEARQARLMTLITTREEVTAQDKMFIPVEDHKPPAAPPDTVRIAHYVAKSGPLTAITISGTISKAIGVSAKSRVRLLRGTDEDEGRLRLEVCDANDKSVGTYSVTGLHSTGATRIITSKVRPKMPGRPIKSVTAEHTIDGKALLLDLPPVFA